MLAAPRRSGVCEPERWALGTSPRVTAVGTLPGAREWRDPGARMSLSKNLAFAAALTLFAAPSLARADEGMWTFDDFPSAAVKARYGVTIDQAWLDHVRGATLRLSMGCSASIVSASGLVLTNHHCVAACIQDLSSDGRDFLKDGFAAADRREERPCPGLQAEGLETLADVTATVAAATDGLTGEAVVRAKAAATARIESEACAGRADTHTCQVVSLYQGGASSLHVFRKYSDVRLVFAPELQTAFFGGDPDNFNFPRYNLDIAFLRLYVDGRPVATPTHLVWSAAAPREGEPVFVVGNPGATSRLLTADQLQTLRDVTLPQTLMQLSELRGRLIGFGRGDPDRARLADRELFGVENSLKVYFGQFQALSQPGFIAAKRAEDEAIRAKVAADPALRRRIGDPWADMAALQPELAALNARYTLLETRAGYGSPLFSYARRLVRAAEERQKPSVQRLGEYSDARLPLLEKELLDAKAAEPSLDAVRLEFWLTKVREYLGADAPETVALLDRDSPEALSAALARTTLGDAAVRQRLWTGGQAAIEASNDPLIRFVRTTDAVSRQARRDYEAKVTGPTARAAEQIAQARFAVLGASVYPDATFSPRISYGAVQGWTHQGKTVPAFTTFSGLWTRATGKPPYDLSPRWLAARDRLPGDTVFNISSSNDITGGNSGSPLINARGEVVGAAFDGNIHSLGGAFAYDGAINRTVSVSTAAATVALRTVYGQEALVGELLGR